MGEVRDLFAAQPWGAPPPTTSQPDLFRREAHPARTQKIRKILSALFVAHRPLYSPASINHMITRLWSYARLLIILLRVAHSVLIVFTTSL
jgi:hypothetical protein